MSALLSIAPATSRVMNRLFGYRPLEESAHETVEVCGAEEEGMRPAIHLPHELDRVTGVHEFSAGIEDEIFLATRNRVSHSETLAYRLRDLCLIDDQLCNFRSLKKLSFKKNRARCGAIAEISKTVAICSTAAGNDYFAHFLLDDLSTAMLAPDFGDAILGGAKAQRSEHIRDYRQVFSIDFAEANNIRLIEAWVFKDYAQNSHRRDRLLAMRQRIRSRFPVPTTGVAPAYIRRGASGNQRILENEPEIENILVGHGFKILDPESMTVDQICQQLSGCPLVVGVEGSQLVHGLLNLADNGVLLCIQPAARFNSVYRGFTNTLGLSWGFAVAEGSSDRFHMPHDRLLATIDLAMRQT